MPQIKQNTVTPLVKVRMLSSIDGIQGVTGLTSASCTLSIARNDGTKNDYAVSTFTLTEITGGSFANTGHYWLTLPSYGTAVLGEVVYTVVTVAGSARVFSGTLEIVQYLASDIIVDVDSVATNTSTILSTVNTINTKIGTPSSSVSADIAAVKSDTGTTLTTVGTINTKIGTPSASVSADIAAVKSDTSSTLTTVGTINTSVGSNLGTNVSALSTTIGTPIHGSIALDIADISASIDLTPVLDAVAAVQATVDDTQDTTNTIASVELGKWVIYSSGPDANRQVFYDSDDNVIVKFNLFAEDGTTPVSEDPYYRVPVP